MDIKLGCTCGSVQGVLRNVTRDYGNRVVCCCDDCQRFAQLLDREAEILDEFGGTDVYQTSQSQVKLDSGIEHIRCMRLTSKGLFRWYTGCCNTPIGNTLTAGFPFISLVHNFIRIESDPDKLLGPVQAFIQTQFALSTPTYPRQAKKFPLGVVLRMMQKMLIWKLRGRNKPSAFFKESGRPIVKAKIINS
ncbi:MAG: hypothetical protein KTR18_08875 [Acidiferrobacterales bacterium]|nr:hypothetical protein [Acidiferrobacterales bacterium]